MTGRQRLGVEDIPAPTEDVELAVARPGDRIGQEGVNRDALLRRKCAGGAWCHGHTIYATMVIRDLEVTRCRGGTFGRDIRPKQRCGHGMKATSPSWRHTASPR